MLENDWIVELKSLASYKGMAYCITIEGLFGLCQVVWTDEDRLPDQERCEPKIDFVLFRSLSSGQLEPLEMLTRF